MAVTILQINNAIKSTIEGATTAVVQGYSELTESIADPLVVQVYPESVDVAMNSGTERTTFKGGVRHKNYVWHVDTFAGPRANIGEDFTRLVALWSDIADEFEQQDVKPYFGLAEIKSFHWRFERVIFDYAGVMYTGGRFVLDIHVY